MKPADRARLTTALRGHVAAIAADLQAKIRAPGPARNRALQLHADEHVGDDFEVWTDLLSRRAAVLWVLKSVYVRVLEDRGLLAPGRLLDPEAQQLFERLAPNLGETAFLRWCYHDLASPHGGLPELFSVQPAELALPSDERSRELLAFWRHRDADTGAHWSFKEELFEGELMGDLYQELDPIVKDRFALCQTPDFVRAFILDRTLTPALETFGADVVRLLDPSCGSGHFLIDGLKRLVTATATQHADWPSAQVVEHALARVVGIDLNDYACALARARLVMTAAELAGIHTLADAAKFHPHVYWADGLEQVEREEAKPTVQFGLFEAVPEQEKPRATFTRSDVRAALKPVLAPKFHAVVANPPYITERDRKSKEYHREKIGKTQRYVSAYREYSLGSPFTERCFQLAEKDGYVGIISGNNFMKREFGKPLIEKVLANLDLTLVVDTSQAFIPFHGTPTVLIFGRNRRPVGDTIRAVMGKRGEVGVPEDPAKGQVWSGIAAGWNQVGFETEFISVAELSREILAKHPWSLGGGGAAELRAHMESVSSARLGSIGEDFGVVCVLREDDLFIQGSAAKRQGVPVESVRPCVEGINARNWAIARCKDVLWPYDSESLEVSKGGSRAALERLLWPWRTILQGRSAFGKTQIERGLAWFEYSMLFKSRARAPLLLAVPKLATHNHFALSRPGTVPIASTHITQLPPEVSEGEHFSLIGVLNSSAACFWMKQVFHNKGLRGQGGGITATDWEQFFEFDVTKLKLFPVPSQIDRARAYSYALDALAQGRAARSVPAILSNAEIWADSATLRAALDARRKQDMDDLLRMVALQEELDWLCYELYGLDKGGKFLAPEDVEPISPTWLPWALNLASSDAEVRAAIAEGEDPGELPTVWFERHRWTPVTSLPADAPKSLRAHIEARRMRICEVPALALIETANFKRRWYCPDYDAEEQDALELWLAEQVEAAAKERSSAFTLEQLVAKVQDDARVLAVCHVLTHRPDFSLSQIVADVLAGEAVPNHRFHVYKHASLVKREAWERMWDDQRREDAGEMIIPEIPPSYVTGDFLKPEYWRHRGKLDVPKERFIAFTEIPGRTGAETFLYGWAGWTPLQRIKAMLAVDEDLEDSGIALADRVGLLDSAWRLLPDLAREDPQAAARLKAELQALVGPTGPSREMLEDWRKRFPPPKAPKAKAARPRTSKRDEETDA